MASQWAHQSRLTKTKVCPTRNCTADPHTWGHKPGFQGQQSSVPAPPTNSTDTTTHMHLALPLPRDCGQPLWFAQFTSSRFALDHPPIYHTLPYTPAHSDTHISRMWLSCSLPLRRFSGSPARVQCCGLLRQQLGFPLPSSSFPPPPPLLSTPWSALVGAPGTSGGQGGQHSPDVLQWIWEELS